MDEVIENILRNTKFANCTAVCVQIKFEPFIFAEPEPDLGTTELEGRDENPGDQGKEPGESEKCAKDCAKDCDAGHGADVAVEPKNPDVEGGASSAAPDEVTEHSREQRREPRIAMDDIVPILDEDLPVVNPGSIVGPGTTDSAGEDSGNTGGRQQEEVPEPVEVEPKRKKEGCVVA